MLRSSTLFLSLVFSVLITGLIPSIAFAGRPDFFEKDTAKSMFEDSVYNEGEQGIMMLLPKREPEPEEDEELNQINPNGPGKRIPVNLNEDSQDSNADQIDPNLPVDQNFPERNKILSKYGSPDEATPIKPQKDSPEPYKAFTEALASGDEDLAYAYARKFVRYQRDLQEMQSKMVEIQGKAMLKEGVLSPDSWAMSNEYDESAHLLANDLENTNKSYELEIPGGAKAMLEEVRAEERKANEQKEAFLKAHLNLSDEEYDREQARSKYAGKLRRSPTDTIELMLFVRMDDYRSELMSKNLQALFEQNQENQSLKFSGLSIENASGSSLSGFAQKTGVSYRVHNGAALAKQLGITESPSLVIISSGANTVSVESGVRSLAFLEEMLK